MVPLTVAPAPGFVMEMNGATVSEPLLAVVTLFSGFVPFRTEWQMGRFARCSART